MLCEGNLVGILRVGIVAVDGLGAVGVFRRGNNLGIVARWFGSLRLSWRLRLGLLLELLRLAGAHGRAKRLHVRGSSAADGRRVLKAVELRRGVHLRRCDRMRSFGATSAAVVAHGLLAESRILSERERVDKGSGSRCRGRSKVEDPEDVDDGKEQEAGGRGLERADRAVDEVVDSRRDEDDASSAVRRKGNVVRLDRVASNDDEYANVKEERVEGRPPSKGSEGLALEGRILVTVAVVVDLA